MPLVLRTMKDKEYCDPEDFGMMRRFLFWISAMLTGDSLTMVKHSRKGETETDLLPMLQNFSITQTDAQTLCLDVRVCAQNPSLNPQLLAQAVEKYLPAVKPDFAFSRRLEIYDANGEVFR